MADPALPPPAEDAPAGATPGVATPPNAREGTLDFDDEALFESRVLTYEQLLRVTDRLADGIKALALPGPPGAANAPPTFVVVTPADLAALELHAGVAPAVRALAAAFAAVAPVQTPHPAPQAPATRGGGEAATRGARDPGPKAIIGALGNPFAAVGTAINAVRGVVESAAALAVLFRRDVKIANSDVAIDDRALQLQVAGELAFRGLRVRVPTVYAPPAPDPPDASAAPDRYDLYDGLGAAYGAQAAAAARVAAIEHADEQAGPAARLRVLGVALGQVEALLLGAPAAAEGAAPPPVAALRRSAALAAAVQPGAYLVRVEVLASGGSRRETRGLVSSTALELSGGVVVNLAVFAHDGVLVGGGTWPSHSGYQAFEGRPRVVSA